MTLKRRLEQVYSSASRGLDRANEQYSHFEDGVNTFLHNCLDGVTTGAVEIAFKGKMPRNARELIEKERKLREAEREYARQNRKELRNKLFKLMRKLKDNYEKQIIGLKDDVEAFEVEIGRHDQDGIKKARLIREQEERIEQLQEKLRISASRGLDAEVNKAKRIAGNKPYFEIGVAIDSAERLSILYFNRCAAESLRQAGYSTADDVERFLQSNSDTLHRAAESLEDKFRDSAELTLSIGDKDCKCKMEVIGDRAIVFSVPLDLYCYRLVSKEISDQASNHSYS